MGQGPQRGGVAGGMVALAVRVVPTATAGPVAESAPVRNTAGRKDCAYAKCSGKPSNQLRAEMHSSRLLSEPGLKIAGAVPKQ